MSTKNVHLLALARAGLALGLVASLGSTAIPTQWARSRLDADLFKNGREIRDLFRPTVARARDSVARIEDRFGRRLAYGTVVGSDGWVLTKASELKGFARVELPDGHSFEARIAGVSVPHDLALLKLDARGLVPVEWNEDAPRVGQWLITPGTKSDRPIDLGVLSVLAREVPVRGAMMGVQLDVSRSAPVITQVVAGTGAEAAGLMVGDEILRLDGRRTLHRDSLIAMIGEYRVGETVRVQVAREGRRLEFDVRLGPRDQRPDSLLLAGDLSEVRSGFPLALQHDTTLAPHECGGPLLDIDGRAVGINIARASRTTSYAIPTSEILALLPDLMSGKLPPDGTHAASARRHAKSKSL